MKDRIRNIIGGICEYIIKKIRYEISISPNDLNIVFDDYRVGFHKCFIKESEIRAYDFVTNLQLDGDEIPESICRVSNNIGISMDEWDNAELWPNKKGKTITVSYDKEMNMIDKYANMAIHHTRKSARIVFNGKEIYPIKKSLKRPTIYMGAKKILYRSCDIYDGTKMPLISKR